MCSIKACVCCVHSSVCVCVCVCACTYWSPSDEVHPGSNLERKLTSVALQPTLTSCDSIHCAHKNIKSMMSINSNHL